jgi:para-aminobenzoate synthetase component 1
MQPLTNIAWQDPITVAAHVSGQYDHCAFLYSGKDVSYSGEKSILAYNIKKQIKAADFKEITTALTNDKELYDNAWFGYLGYGLKDCLEILTQDKKATSDLPHLWMMQFDTIVEWNHRTQRMTIFGKHDVEVFNNNNSSDITLPTVTTLHSNMSKNDYFDHVESIRSAIFKGDLYEANITRKFFGNFESTPAPFSVFLTLAKISPAAYSSFIKLENKAIISSSPEQFLHISQNGKVQTRPIKGSAPRFADKTKDDASLAALKNSEKDKAENLMIVDLMRNDLAHHCKLGSIKVNKLFATASYPTVHHMFSTISGQKKTDSSTMDIIKASFPPGSMTGAPKIMAMNLCSKLEKDARGVYSGAIGWFGGDGSADLSVVIRTIITDGSAFEFQVGGAIVADSTPKSEWAETITKARAICQALNIPITQIEAI